MKRKTVVQKDSLTIEKSKFDAILSRLLSAPPAPLSSISPKRKPVKKRAAKKRG